MKLSYLIAASALTALTWAGIATSVQAAPFPDPQAAAPQSLAATQMVREYPIGTFLENLVVEGNFVIATDFVGKTLNRIDRRTGATKVIATLPNHAPGVAARRGGGYVLSGSTGDGKPVVFGVTAAGAVSILAELPQGAFPNGISNFDQDRYLVADSARGAIYLVNVRTGSVTTWVQDAILTSDGVVKPFIPGANGVRRHGNFVYISSMQRELLLRVPVQADGSAGAIQTVARNVFLDDFAVARDGTVYGTTHVFDSVIRIDTNGRVTTIANHDQGLRGPTSAFFGPEGNGNQVLYVTNNGQLYVQPETGPETGRLVRIDLRRRAQANPQSR
jgi:sugar lactone lactonase YvrE